jgi:hypothetical protein
LIQERPIVLGAISGAPIPIAQVEVLFIEVDLSLLPQVRVILGLKTIAYGNGVILVVIAVISNAIVYVVAIRVKHSKYLKSAKSTSIAFADCVIGDIRVARYAIPAKVTTRNIRRLF